jgi:hypothetical protein
MRVYLAPEEVKLEKGDITCFLAGGITNCPTWQNDVIKAISKYFDFMKQEIPGSEDGDDLILINPRREHFPINQPNAAREQITWEFDNLQKMDIFSMFLCSGPSDQLICMYELGRNILKMQYEYPESWKDRIVITCNSNYKRLNDVLVQTGLATDGLVKVNVVDGDEESVAAHINAIKEVLKYVHEY